MITRVRIPDLMTSLTALAHIVGIALFSNNSHGAIIKNLLLIGAQSASLGHPIRTPSIDEVRQQR